MPRPVGRRLDTVSATSLYHEHKPLSLAQASCHGTQALYHEAHQSYTTMAPKACDQLMYAHYTIVYNSTVDWPPTVHLPETVTELTTNR